MLTASLFILSLENWKLRNIFYLYALFVLNISGDISGKTSYI